MEQTIRIIVPDGMKAVCKENTVWFEDVNPTLQPKTWEEYCRYVDKKYPKKSTSTDGSLHDWLLTPSQHDLTMFNAILKLRNLREYYNHGWGPNSILGTRYSIVQRTKKDYQVESSSNGVRFLSFKTRENAEEFLNNFRDLIEEAGDLI